MKRIYLITLIILALLLAACGNKPAAEQQKTEMPTEAGIEAPEIEATATEAPPSEPSASEAPPAAPAFTPDPSLPSYSEIISTYPPDEGLYDTDVQVSNVAEDGNWTFTAGTIRSCGGTPFFKCYGVKITIVENTVTIDGVSYPPGSLLTVDKDLNWIQVSSWD